MSADPSHDPLLEQWIQRCCDGSLTAEEAQQLNDRLRGDPEACELYLNQMTLHSLLDAEFNRPAHPLPNLGKAEHAGFHLPTSTASGRTQGRSWTAALLGYGLAACFAVAFFLKSPPSIEPTETGVAVLAFAEDCQWSSPSNLKEGSEVVPGPMILDSGTAILRFRGGTEMLFEGPVSLDLQTAGRAVLARGKVVVQSIDGAMSGFHLLTPSTTIVDHEGEFTAEVTAAGSTLLHAQTGQLTWSPMDQPSESTPLAAGHSMQVDALGRAQTLPDAPSSGFREWVQQSPPRERPDLMTVYDGFHYDPGRYPPGEIERGKGWAGPWRLRTPEEIPHDDEDETTDMEIVHNKLNVVWPIEGGRLGMLKMPPGKTFRIREMAKPIDMNQDAIHYFSMMVHEPDHSARTPSDRPAEGMRITFRSASDYLGESLSFGLSNRLNPRIQVRQGEGFVSLATAPSRQTTLWVGKIVCRENGTDHVSFRIYGEDDRLDFVEPGTWHVETRNLRQSAALNLVVLTSQGTSARIIDELRIGPTWRSVVPFSLLITAN